MLVKRRKQEISDAFLNWLVKPFLLLALILFVTLGLYINMYIFSVLDTAALVAGAAMPFLGFIIGGSLMLIARQTTTTAKTLSIESAILNSEVTIAALRFTLPQPDGDLASSAAMWLLFLTPAPIVLMFLVYRVKKKIMFHFKKKEIADQQKSMIMKSFAAMTNNAIQIGRLTEPRPMLETLTEPDTLVESPSPTSYGNGTESRRLISESQSFNDHPHAAVNSVSFSISPASENIHRPQTARRLEDPTADENSQDKSHKTFTRL